LLPIGQIVQRHHQAQLLLDTMPLVYPEKLLQLLMAIIEPVQYLVQSINGTQQPAAPFELTYLSE
jgi:hypothetical protein